MIAHFLFTMVWSVGATLDGQSRIKFDEFFRNLCEMEGSQATYPKYGVFHGHAYNLRKSIFLSGIAIVYIDYIYSSAMRF